MKKDILSFYLYISWDSKKTDQIFASYMKVAKAMICDELSFDFKSLGENVFIFSSHYDFKVIKRQLSHKRFPYLLVDVSMSVSTGLLSMHLEDDQIDGVNNFIAESKVNEISYLETKLQEAVEFEDWEKAIIYRDALLKK